MKLTLLTTLSLMVLTINAQARVSTDQHIWHWKGITPEGQSCTIHYFNQSEDEQFQVEVVLPTSNGSVGLINYYNSTALPFCDFGKKTEKLIETYRYLLPTDSVQETILEYRDAELHDLKSVTLNSAYGDNISPEKQCKKIKAKDYLWSKSCTNLVLLDL